MDKGRGDRPDIVATVIDPQLLRDDPDAVRAAQARRGLSGDAVDRALEADRVRRAAIADFEQLRAEQKQLSKQIPQAQGDERAALLTRTKTLSADVKEAEATQNQADEEWRDALKEIPNVAALRLRPAARTTTSYSSTSALRVTSRPRASSRATTSSSAACLARSISSAAPRSRVRASTS